MTTNQLRILITIIHNSPPPHTTKITAPRAQGGMGLRLASWSCREGFVGFLPWRAALAKLAFFCLISWAVGCGDSMIIYVSLGGFREKNAWWRNSPWWYCCMKVSFNECKALTCWKVIRYSCFSSLLMQASHWRVTDLIYSRLARASDWNMSKQRFSFTFTVPCISLLR